MSDLGATHWHWIRPVRRVVRKAEHNFPAVKANTYYGHPWPSWDGVSVDFWGPGGRGDPIATQTGYRLRQFLMQLPDAPYIRHTIFLHELWTSWGGTTRWNKADHSGDLRHLHVTYWK